MAELIVLDGQQFKRRNPWGAWGWCFLVIPYYVWYYRQADESKRFLRDEAINPVLALLSQFVPIVNWVSIWRTGTRIARMQAQAGLQPTVQPVLGLVASFFYVLHVAYYQSEINKVWDAMTSRGAAAALGSAPSNAGLPAPAPPPPPPEA
jgi:hypothetical protein